MAGSKIRNVAIVTKINNSEAEGAAARIVELLNNNKIKSYSLIPLIIKGSSSVTPDELKDVNIDLIFAIGGDGTTLRAFRIIPGNAPVVSMNVGGHRGLLSDIGIGSVEEAVRSILAGNFHYDSRIRIQASTAGHVLPPALNDILFTRASLTRTPAVTVKFMGDAVSHRMDGLIISTPTGSTGHSLSLGYAVLHENLDCLMLGPVAPLNKIPQLVIPASSDIEIKSSLEMNLVVDGQEVFKVAADQSVKVSKYLHDARFVRLKKSGMRQLAKLGFQ